MPVYNNSHLRVLKFKDLTILEREAQQAENPHDSVIVGRKNSLLAARDFWQTKQKYIIRHEDKTNPRREKTNVNDVL